MRISQKAQYALSAVLDLALHAPPNKGVRSAEIARRANVPDKFLEAILVELRKGLAPRFGLLAPVLGAVPPHYRLFVEINAGADLVAALAQQLDRELRTNYHYAYCRDLGQLGPIAAVVVTEGCQRYQGALAARGMRLGDIKPVALDAGSNWDEVFAGGSRTT